VIARRISGAAPNSHWAGWLPDAGFAVKDTLR